MIYFTSDYHLGDNRFDIYDRPFVSTSEYLSALTYNHNKIVKDTDIVYILGDVCNLNTPEHIKYIDKFKGTKILVRGNHDRNLDSYDLSKYFEYAIPEGEGIDIDIKGMPCFLTHYPSRGKEDRFNLVGHVHGTWKVQLNMLNVGVDVHNFKPVPLDRIPFYFNAIENFYDQDIWAAYSKQNTNYIDIRGKAGTYF